MKATLCDLCGGQIKNNDDKFGGSIRVKAWCKETSNIGSKYRRKIDVCSDCITRMNVISTNNVQQAYDYLANVEERDLVKHIYEDVENAKQCLKRVLWG